MADIQPFLPLHPPPSRAARVASVPYDVVSTDEARAIAEGNPDSFLHVTRPEIDVDPGQNGTTAFQQARNSLDGLRERGALVLETEPCLYVYRLEWEGQSQTGLVGAYSVDEYDQGAIKKHEFTRPDKEADRTDHMEALGVQPGPVFLAHRATPELDALSAQITSVDPWIDFDAPDGVRHSVWRVSETDALVEAMARLEALYVADGHHRSAAASNVRRRRAEAGTLVAADPAERFLAVSFPADQLRILSYNRLVLDLGGRSTGDLLAALRAAGPVEEDVGGETDGPFEARFYFDKRWVRLGLSDDIEDAVASLAVEQVEQRVLAPFLGIEDQRTDPRLAFVGGIRGTAELVRRVDSGEAAFAISLPPVTAEQLLSVADAGQTMPPKSTWFEPKLRSGLFVYPI